jgi:hypothetical protein
MKTINQHILYESDCLRKFGKVLFGSTFGTEPDTDIEAKISDKLEKWLGFEMVFQQKSEMVRAFKELKKCTGHFPAELTPETTVLYRGTRREIDVLKQMKDLKVQSISALPGKFISGKLKYTSMYPMQSWSVKAVVAHGFAERGSLGGSWKSDSYGMREHAPNMIPAVFMANFSRNDLLFNSKFLDKFAGKKWGALMQGEGEIIRISNSPVDAKLYISVEALKAATDIQKRPDLIKILTDIGLTHKGHNVWS